MDAELDRWFAEAILPHEAALVRYLTRTWPHRDDIHDLRQETYIRVYEAAARARPLAPKSFLFTTARHLMVDRVRRERIVSIEATGDMEVLNVLVEEISVEQRVGARQELKRLADALDALPDRCREAIWMRKVEQLSQREVALRMGVSEGAIEKHVTKGVRLLARFLYGPEGTAAGDEECANTASEPEHGQQHRD